MNDTTIERRYAMIHVRAGYWLLPSNDGQTIWRLCSYVEHGDGEWQDEKGKWHKITGTFWETARMPMKTMQRLTDNPLLDNESILYAEEWQSSSMGLRSRKEAIAEALAS